jgi:hypothetical protein
MWLRYNQEKLKRNPFWRKRVSLWKKYKLKSQRIQMKILRANQMIKKQELPRLPFLINLKLLLRFNPVKVALKLLPKKFKLKRKHRPQSKMRKVRCLPSKH